MDPLVISAISAGLCALFGGLIGNAFKGRPLLGFILGLLFGPVGCAILFLMGDHRWTCSYCEGRSNPKETHCSRCGRPLGPPPAGPSATPPL